MNYLLPILLLILVFYLYIRLSKRISGIQLELSQELKNEIITLIAEFNHSAEKNITLMEARVDEAKIISREIADQLGYMKKLKENLEKEIRETEARLQVMVTNQKAVLEDVHQKQEEGKTIIARTYAMIQKQTAPLLNPPKEEKMISPVIQEEIPSKEEPAQQQTRKDQILSLWKQGLSSGEIALKLGITRGETDFTLKLLTGESSSANS